MPTRSLVPGLAALLAGALAFSGCGSASKSGASTGSQPESAGALSADARSAATGDIPDNQSFLTLDDSRLRVSMLYPEGWTVKTSQSGVTISDNSTTYMRQENLAVAARAVVA